MDPLDLLDELLAITEALKSKMDHEQRTTWERIAVETADLRNDGKEV